MSASSSAPNVGPQGATGKAVVAELYHQILIWPLKLEGEGMEGDTWMDELDKFIQRNSEWVSNDDLYRRYNTPEATRYAEFVYFHPFVRNLLFSSESVKALRKFERRDIAKMRVRLQGSEHLLDVLAVRLFVARTGIILVTVEIRGENIPLRPLEDLADSIRRAYPPYWTEQGKAGHCPLEVGWLDSNGNTLASDNYEDRESHLIFVREYRRAPVSTHWRWLLEPLEAAASRRWKYVDIEDERIPSMCYFAFGDPSELQDGDFFRLGILNEQGDSATLPYSTLFFDEFQKRCCYDRFWDPHTAGHEWMTTRYICTGYSFVMLGKMDPMFYTNAENGGLAHFRHHYFQMGLIAQLQRASLLVFNSRLAAAIKDSEPRHYETIGKLVSDIADFAARFWFVEVSNQVQAQELFNRWSEQLGTRKLFQQVMDSARIVQQDLADRQRDNQTKATLFLTRVGAYGISISLWLTIAVYAEPLTAIRQNWPPWETFWSFVGSAMVLGVGLGFFVDKFIHRSTHR